MKVHLITCQDLLRETKWTLKLQNYTMNLNLFGGNKCCLVPNTKPRTFTTSHGCDNRGQHHIISISTHIKYEFTSVSDKLFVISHRLGQCKP